MAYGISIENNSGFIQINEEYSNYKVIASGMASGSTDNFVNFTDYGVIPLVMVRPQTFGHKIASEGLSFTNKFSAICLDSVGNGPQNFYYKVLVPVKNVASSSESFGLRVYNSSGEINYDSGHTDVLRVASVLTFQPPANGGQGNTNATYITTPTSAGSYYVSINGTGVFNIGLDPPPVNWEFITVTQSTENNFTITTEAMRQGQNVGYQRQNTSATFLFGAFT